MPESHILFEAVYTHDATTLHQTKCGCVGNPPPSKCVPDRNYAGKTKDGHDFIVTDGVHDELGFNTPPLTQKRNNCDRYDLEEYMIQALAGGYDKRIHFTHSKEHFKVPPGPKPEKTPRQLLTQATIGYNTLVKAMPKAFPEHAPNTMRYTVIHDAKCFEANQTSSTSTYIDSAGPITFRGHCNKTPDPDGDNVQDGGTDPNLYPTYSVKPIHPKHRVLASHMMVRILLADNRKLLRQMPGSPSAGATALSPLAKNAPLTNNVYNAVYELFNNPVDATLRGDAGEYILEDMYQNWIWQMTLIHMYWLKYGKSSATQIRSSRPNTDIVHGKAVFNLGVNLDANLNAFARLSCIVFEGLDADGKTPLYRTTTNTQLGGTPGNWCHCIVAHFHTEFWNSRVYGNWSDDEESNPPFKNAELRKFTVIQRDCGNRILAFNAAAAGTKMRNTFWKNHPDHNPPHSPQGFHAVRPRKSNTPVRYPYCVSKPVADCTTTKQCLTEITIAQLLKASGDQSHLTDWLCKVDYLDNNSIYPILQTGDRPLTALALFYLKNFNVDGGLIFDGNQKIFSEKFYDGNVRHWYSEENTANPYAGVNNAPTHVLDELKRNSPSWKGCGIARGTAPMAPPTAPVDVDWAKWAGEKFTNAIGSFLASRDFPKVVVVVGAVAAVVVAIAGGKTPSPSLQSALKRPRIVPANAEADTAALDAFEPTTAEAFKATMFRAGPTSQKQPGRVRMRMKQSRPLYKNRKRSENVLEGLINGRREVNGQQNEGLQYRKDTFCVLMEYVRTFGVNVGGHTLEEKAAKIISDVAWCIYANDDPTGFDTQWTNWCGEYKSTISHPSGRVFGADGDVATEEEQLATEEEQLDDMTSAAVIFDRFFDIIRMLDKINILLPSPQEDIAKYCAHFSVFLDEFTRLCMPSTPSSDHALEIRWQFTPLEIYIYDLKERLALLNPSDTTPEKLITLHTDLQDNEAGRLKAVRKVHTAELAELAGDLDWLAGVGSQAGAPDALLPALAAEEQLKDAQEDFNWYLQDPIQLANQSQQEQQAAQIAAAQATDQQSLAALSANEWSMSATDNAAEMPAGPDFTGQLPFAPTTPWPALPAVKQILSDPASQPMSATDNAAEMPAGPDFTGPRKGGKLIKNKRSKKYKKTRRGKKSRRVKKSHKKKKVKCVKKSRKCVKKSRKGRNTRRKRHHSKKL
jgi:hypothetical protein